MISNNMENFSKTELENEKWKDIDGYDGMYQVSDLGRVRSKYSGEWKMLRFDMDRHGYFRVVLSKYGKHKRFLVHRLVAQAFIKNDDDTKNQINHIDECKQNNRLSNIEYCTAQYNMTYNNLPFRKKNSKRLKIKDLYDPNLTYQDNIDIFKSNGIECCRRTVYELRKDLKLERPKPVLDKIKSLYNPNLTYKENLEVFKANGVDCSRDAVKRIRKDLGLTKNNSNQ